MLKYISVFIVLLVPMTVAGAAEEKSVLVEFQPHGVLFADQDGSSFGPGPRGSCQPSAGDKAQVLAIKTSGLLHIARIRLLSGTCSGIIGLASPSSISPF
ncbi:hypothetical protein [Burkholderia gladioli]|uniref:hypothetical protein n=1 Tax=Burkholderia gladioli TaxID=28095 RepID=UPI0012D46231|nr:hypothetical protein [Burkholderia gladioli]MDN7602892.1 hypothetical protein [Burkholderia gladioli]URV24118.1 hypothetical protein NAL90_14655 [Burkholderia gladioli]